MVKRHIDTIGAYLCFKLLHICWIEGTIGVFIFYLVQDNVAAMGDRTRLVWGNDRPNQSKWKRY